MTLNYSNPDDWGKSPLTDKALRMQQFRAENPQPWSAMIEADLESLNSPAIIEITAESDSETWARQEPTEEQWPPFTGTEFLATHNTIDDHPYSAAFGQFLGNGIDPNTANLLAFGENRFDLISNDFDDELRQRATRIYSRFADMGYWDESGETDRQPSGWNLYGLQ